MSLARPGLIQAREQDQVQAREQDQVQAREQDQVQAREAKGRARYDLMGLGKIRSRSARESRVRIPGESGRRLFVW